MKKIFALILAIALLLTSVAAFAESVEAEKPKGTPNFNTFATMKVKYVGNKFATNQDWNAGNQYYEITLSKPVDRLLIVWGEKGAEPEELAVDENLQATALCWNHKYMPGVTHRYVTSYSRGGKTYTLNNKNTTNFTATVLGYDVANSETVYKTGVSRSPYYADGSNTVAFENEINYPKIVLDPKAPISIRDQIMTYYNHYGVIGANYDLVIPTRYVDKDGKTQWSEGYIQRIGYSYKDIDPKSITTISATPAQTAFMTVQNGWAVYYNRSGKIVGIELFEGQF